MKLYPYGLERGDGWVSLFLVRLHSSHSYHRIHFRLGLKKVKKLKHVKKAINSENDSLAPFVVFYANNIEMGVVNFPEEMLVTARKKNENLVAYCNIFFIEEIVLLLAEPSSRFKETMGILDHSQQLCSGTALPATENIKWKLKFSELPTDEDIFIDSPEFFFANAIWCLRIYPNGKKGDNNKWMQLFLLQLKSQCSGHICYRLGLKLRGDKEHATFIHEAHFHSNSTQLGVVNLLQRSKVMESHKLYLSDGILTVFCEILLTDEPTVALSKEPKCTLPITVQPLQILKSSQQSFITEVDVFMPLDITMFSAFPMNFNYFIESEKFIIANATWCLRLYPNGKEKKGYSNDWMHLLLVRLSSDRSLHTIHYNLGLMKRKRKERTKRKQKELNSFIHMANIHENGFEFGITNLIKRSDIMNGKKIFLIEDTLTAFCEIWIIEEAYSLCNPVSYPELADDSPGPQIEMSNYFSFGVLTHQSDLDVKEVTWKVLSADVVLLENDNAIDSPLFLFMNGYWGFRMYVCAENSNSLFGSVELYLIRLSIPSLSLSYEANLKVLNDDSWKDFNTSYSNGIFNRSIMKLGLTDIHFASDGYLTIHCQLIIFSEKKETFTLSEAQKLVSDYSLDFSRSKIQCGILHEQSYLKSMEICWHTFDFSGSEKKIGLYVNSPTFELAKNTWMLQLYPNGLKRKSEQMCIILIRLFSDATEYDVICEIYDKNSKSKGTLSKIIANFRGNCTKSCPAILDLPTIRKSKSTERLYLSLHCRLFISKSIGKAYIETPLTAGNFEPALKN